MWWFAPATVGVAVIVAYLVFSADNKSELAVLPRLPPPEKPKIATAVKGNKAKSVREAIGNREKPKSIGPEKEVMKAPSAIGAIAPAVSPGPNVAIVTEFLKENLPNRPDHQEGRDSCRGPSH